VTPTLTIENTKQGSYILKRIKDAHRARGFVLDESDLASLEIYFDPKTLGSVLSSLREAKNTPSVKLSDV
jgi:hypothetical protein